MKRFLVVVSIVLVLGLLVAGLTTPIFAHDPDGGSSAPTNNEVWEAMHEACENGDWEAMTEAAEEVHGEDFDNMPCHDEDDYTPTNGWDGMGGHMGGGMIGGMH